MVLNLDLDNNGKISKWELFPYWFDRLRLFPRAFISMYMYMFYRVVEWFMALPDPNMAQAGLVSVVTGAGAAWFGLYVNSGNSNPGPIVLQSSSTPDGTSTSLGSSTTSYRSTRSTRSSAARSLSEIDSTTDSPDEQY